MTKASRESMDAACFGFGVDEGEGVVVAVGAIIRMCMEAHPYEGHPLPHFMAVEKSEHGNHIQHVSQAKVCGGGFRRGGRKGCKIREMEKGGQCTYTQAHPHRARSVHSHKEKARHSQSLLTCIIVYCNITREEFSHILRAREALVDDGKRIDSVLLFFLFTHSSPTPLPGQLLQALLDRGCAHAFIFLPTVCLREILGKKLMLGGLFLIDCVYM